MNRQANKEQNGNRHTIVCQQTDSSLTIFRTEINGNKKH